MESSWSIHVFQYLLVFQNVVEKRYSILLSKAICWWDLNIAEVLCHFCRRYFKIIKVLHTICIPRYIMKVNIWKNNSCNKIYECSIEGLYRNKFLQIMKMNWNWYNLETEIDLLKGNMYITRRHNITFSSRVIENMQTQKKLHNITEVLLLI